MIMRTFPLMAMLFSIAACSGSKKVAGDGKPANKGNWQVQKVIADGNSNEWDKSNMEFDKSSKIAYKITNDETNLYVLVTAMDNASQTKILRGGMSVFIDPKAKKKESVSINFPIASGDEPMMGGNQRSQSDQQGQPAQKPDMQKMKAQALISANQYSLSGFIKGDGGYTITQGNDAGVAVKIDFNTSGELVYEAVIPLQSFYQQGANAKNSGTISVGLKINGLPKPNMSGGMPGGGGGGMSGGMGGPGGGGGMPPGGGMGPGGTPGGGMGGSGQSDMQKMFNEVKIWKNITIAQKA